MPAQSLTRFWWLACKSLNRSSEFFRKGLKLKCYIWGGLKGSGRSSQCVSGNTIIPAFSVLYVMDNFWNILLDLISLSNHVMITLVFWHTTSWQHKVSGCEKVSGEAFFTINGFSSSLLPLLSIRRRSRVLYRIITLTTNWSTQIFIYRHSYILIT